MKLWVRQHKGLSITLIVLILVVLAVLLAPILVPYPADLRGHVNPSLAFNPPSGAHWFGTDDLGRDLFTLVLFGGRISIGAGFAAIVFALVIGVPLGLVAGYVGGWVDEAIMRFTDIVLSFPPLLLAVAIASLLRPNLMNAIIAIALSWWPWYTRLIRSQVGAVRHSGYVEAAILAAQPSRNILWRHVLPNTLSPVIIQASMDLGSVILTLAGLGFLGMGAQPPSPEWGLLVSEGRNYIMSDWWYVTFPGLCILLVAGIFNVLGDGLRDWLDPRRRGLGA